ncbi:MAG: SDR family NAD(P)-dependent oxidoreductase [Acidimicrobiales bacterium]|nr:SDR family NAD(P)-dependent oxidoreductase [Acidimicrobiales bacterium]
MSARWSSALVTGATSGIGEACARSLAAAGTSVLLVARGADRLDALAADLRGRHGVRAEALAADLSTPEGIAVVEARLASAAPAVDLLVNAAGATRAGPFHRSSPEEEAALVCLNVLAVVRLTRAALGPMIDAGRGAVLNVASTAAFQVAPMLATYAASKAFTLSFTHSLGEELAGTGVTATVLVPGYTRTAFHARAGLGEPEDVEWATADEVAVAGLHDAAAGVATSVPGPAHEQVVALRRERAVAEVRAAVLAGEPGFRRRCLDLARRPGMPPAVRAKALVSALVPRLARRRLRGGGAL